MDENKKKEGKRKGCMKGNEDGMGWRDDKKFKTI